MVAEENDKGPKEVKVSIKEKMMVRGENDSLTYKTVLKPSLKREFSIALIIQNPLLYIYKYGIGGNVFDFKAKTHLADILRCKNMVEVREKFKITIT